MLEEDELTSPLLVAGQLRRSAVINMVRGVILEWGSRDKAGVKHRESVV